MKKILSLLMAATMIYCYVSVPVVATANDLPESSEFIQNPYSATLTSQEDVEEYNLEEKDYIGSSTKVKYDGTTYYTYGRELYKPVRDSLEDRDSTISFNFASDTDITPEYKYVLITMYYDDDDMTEALFNILDGATDDALSQTTTDGDYIRWHYAGFYYSQEYIGKSSGKYLYQISLDIEYYHSQSEEKQITAVVDDFVDDIRSQSLSDYEVMKEIHDFICARTTYNYDVVGKSSLDYTTQDYYSFSAYGALVDGACVCQGYALAFYRICEELGYSARFVSSDQETGCHAWNIVELDNEYYFVDCTWDDEDDNNISYDYFLKCYDTMTAEEPMKELDPYIYPHTLEDTFDTEYFNDNYRAYFADDNYDNTTQNITNCAISLSDTEYTYAAQSIKPSVTVKYNGKILTKGVDYTVSYKNNLNVGTATVEINGIGDFEGTTHRQFVINAKTISKSWFSLSTTTYTYNGYYKKPTVNCTKISKSSYSISYSNNKVPGVATVTIKGKGNYTGTVKLTFKIKPAKMSKPSVATDGRGTNSITLTWKKATGATGYVIQRIKSGKWVNVKTVTSASTTKYKVTGLSSNTTYSFRIRAYKKTSSGTVVYGDYSNTLITCTKPKATSIKSLTTSSKAITVKWSSVNCSYYQVQYSTNSSFKNAKTVTVKGLTSKKIKSLTRGKKYYVRVRAVKSRTSSAGTTYKYYSSWSAKKSITCK